MNLEQIDTSTTAGKAEVMRLAAKGRRVADDADGRWTPIKHPCWNWEEYSYAIISEPVGPDEVWVTVSEGDPIDVYKSETTAACSHSLKVVRYVRAD
ncbi:hypothetical protein [Stenotrophomonas indicatrix]|uniref:hypothetical protein n=1 Tax=Stenotrophomonas indicatrix TaxID=2045451 RepID=UPI0008BE7896|nr:hypothetical protein [Stenotrophomonas indicatrix]SET91688.1 hypothetical protein SAMN05720615_109233 [Stenotrophomonas indicatrix]SEU12475.1 hypothetical protein SAMN05720615_11815 [Stenotrophomonas indicatrix]